MSFILGRRSISFLTKRLASLNSRFSYATTAELKSKREQEIDDPNSPVFPKGAGKGAAIALAFVAAGAYYFYYDLEKYNRIEIPPRNKGNWPIFDKNDVTVVFVLGGPGAGKGTQCQKLVRDFGFVHLSAGDLLREERQRSGSPYGDLISTYIKEGKIVPMEITLSLLERKMKESNSKRFLIDGFPREIDQGEAFETQICESSMALYFECPVEVMQERLLKRGETSGRVDDNLKSIRKRFDTFKTTSLPVIERFESQNKLFKVSCVNSEEEVYQETKNIFENYFKGHEKNRKLKA